MKYLLLLLQFLGVPSSWLFPTPAERAPIEEEDEAAASETGHHEGHRDGRRPSASTDRTTESEWEPGQTSATEQPVDDISNGF